eukprot:TRINITY_DN2568_c0_g2_i1.p1 TRINITY_DN2568_c0_g2~~TRINITY_DN2568_c0_g2_i1.p1  ORF type:complete len:635 (-),score=158.96 TRINITY_DN2568_c0_g2_i1:230-2134(-)
MSFWRTFGFQTISQVETILDRDHFTLEDLMDEEELLQECKSHNKKLIDYLVKNDTLTKLFNYLTVEPEENADMKRRSKYPYLACEILCSDVWSIYDSIFENEAHLDGLYSYLEKPAPLNPLLVGYVSKVAGVLLQKKSIESINYLKKKGNVIFANFMKHLDNASVTDLLIKVIGSETPESHGILQWLSEANLVSQLISKLNISSEAEVHENAAQTLVDIIAVSGTNTSPLLSQIESPQAITQLLDSILVGENPSILSNGLTILMELFKRTTQETLNNDAKLEDLPPLYSILVKNLDKFTKLLLDPTNKTTMTLTTGTVVPLGLTRLKIVEFILCLIKTNFSCLHQELVKSGVLSACLDLFFIYVWNNFLHATVDCLLATIFDGENQELEIALIQECKLLDRIVQANKDNEAAVSEPKGMRRGNMAFITRISNLLCQEAQKNEQLHKLLEEHTEWNVFVNTALAKIQQLEAPIGHKPLSLEPTTSEEEEEGFDTTNTNPATLVFTQYLAQQGFTSVYDGFNEDYEDGDGENYYDAGDGFDHNEGKHEEDDNHSFEGQDHSGSSSEEESDRNEHRAEENAVNNQEGTVTGNANGGLAANNVGESKEGQAVEEASVKENVVQDVKKVVPNHIEAVEG